MQKMTKRVLSGILAFFIILTVLSSVITIDVSAADIASTNPTWWIGNGTANPGNSSTYWSYHYFQNGAFSKMTYLGGEATAYYWRPTAATDTELLNAWSLTSSASRYSAIGFSVAQSGTVTCYANNAFYTNANGAEIMAVLQNAETGKFYPVYPTAGKWEWKTLSGTKESPDVASGTTLFTADYKTNDMIYFITRPVGENATGYSVTMPKIAMTEGAAENYPAASSFTTWDPPKSTTSTTSWYAQQNQNPWPGSPFTFAYLNNSTKVISTMENFKTDHWESTSAKAWAGAWYTNNTNTESAVITYTASKAGTVAIADNNKLKVITGSGEYMIVQESADGGFCPIYPTKGVWETTALTAGETTLNVNTYVKAGDKLHLVYKSADGTWTQISTVPSVTFTPYDTDFDSLRPADGDFGLWDPPKSTTSTTSWYAQQNQHPWTESPWTFTYLNNSTKVITKMEEFNTDHWESSAGQSWIGSWYANTSATESAVITYTAKNAGTVAIADSNSLKVTTGSGEYMIVQENADGSFCPIYPTKGVWETKALTTGETILNVNTYVKAGDRLHMVYKSADGTWTQVSTIPTVTFTPYDTDSGSLRPDDSNFGLWDPPKSITSDTSWVGGQNQNPWPESPWTFAYFDNTAKVITTMENFKEGTPGHWESSTGRAWASTWYTNSTQEQSAVISYTATYAGIAVITDKQGLAVKSGAGKFIIVQERKDGSFYPIYPTKGVWETKALSASSTTFECTTCVQAGDKIHMIYSSADGTWTQIATTPNVVLAPYSAASQHIYTTVVTPPTCTEEGKTTHTCACGASYTTDILAATGHDYQQGVCAICQKGAADVIYWNIALQDDFAVHFYVGVEPEYVDQLSVKVTVGGDTTTYTLTDLTSTEKGYQLTTCVAAAQMNDTITVECMLDSKVVETDTYTVRQYCDSILSNSDHSKYHAIAKEMLNYGAMAQLYFNYNKDTLANTGIVGTATENVPESTNEMVYTDNIAAISYAGAKLVCRDRVAVRFFFNGDITGCTFTANDLERKVFNNGTMYYVEIPDILPQNLDQQITLTVTDAEGNTLNITYGPMNYIVRMSKKGSQALKDMLKAMYNYHLVTKAYCEAQS